MSELLHQLGIDWRAFLAQALNFIALILVLRVFAYKPVLSLLKKRRDKIADGLAKAEEAAHKLSEVNEIAAHRLKEADQQALEVLRETENKAKALESNLLDQAKKKEEELLKNTDLIIAAKAEAARKEMRGEAVHLVKTVLLKAVELDPKAVDEKLISQAAKEA